MKDLLIYVGKVVAIGAFTVASAILLKTIVDPEDD